MSSNGEEITPNDLSCPARRDKFAWVFPGGESYESALPRARTAASTIAATASDRVLVVSHEMIGRLLRMVLLDLSVDEAMALSQPHDIVIEVAGGRANAIDVAGGRATAQVLRWEAAKLSCEGATRRQ